jgi:hypothetical protein
VVRAWQAGYEQEAANGRVLAEAYVGGPKALFPSRSLDVRAFSGLPGCWSIARVEGGGALQTDTMFSCWCGPRLGSHR